MSSILHQLYCGDLSPQEEYLNDGQGDFYGTFNRHKQHFKQLLETQAPDLLTSFHVFTEDSAFTYQTDIEDAFCRGFGLAVKLLTEAMSF